MWLLHSFGPNLNCLPPDRHVARKNSAEILQFLTEGLVSNITVGGCPCASNVSYDGERCANICCGHLNDDTKTHAAAQHNTRDLSTTVGQIHLKIFRAKKSFSKRFSHLSHEFTAGMSSLIMPMNAISYALVLRLLEPLL